MRVLLTLILDELELGVCCLTARSHRDAMKATLWATIRNLVVYEHLFIILPSEPFPYFDVSTFP